MQENEEKIKFKTKVIFGITKGIWGGAQEYVYTLATSLPSKKYDVVVVCGEGGTLPEKLAEKNIRVIQMQTIRRDISFFTEFLNLFKLIKILRKEKPDVLHLNSSKMGGIGGVAGRMCGIPKIIFTAHGWGFNESRPWIVLKFFLFLHWLTVMLSHTTIAVSEKTRGDLTELPFIAQKIFVVHNGIGQIDFLDKESAKKILTEYSKSEPTEIIIGTISELHKNKGLDFLISACRGLPDKHSVYIIGDGEEKENLENEIKRLGLQNKIFLTGRIENAKTLLKAFDIFTLTSRTEALPYTILEAGFARLPVVASAVGGIPEIIENGKSGILVQAGDIEQISKSLKNLVLEPQKREIFGNALQEKVEKEFSLQKMISETEKFYT